MSVGLVADYFPSLYERMAVRLQPYRFRFMATGAVTWALLFAAMLWAARFHPVFPSASGPYLKVAFGATWVVITTSSGLFLCTFWFHPSSGVLRQRSTDTAAIRALRTIGRLWASFVLSLMFLAIPAPLGWCF